MSWALLLLVLSALCECSNSQPVLTQPTTESVTPGATAKLACTISSNRNTIFWYQQRLGNPPRFILYGSTSRGSGISDRFTGSSSGNVEYLTITSVKAEDDADYYCAMWYSSTFIFGGGTQLNVLSGETKTPALNVFPPSSEEVATNKATLVCLMSDFYPGSVTVTWKADDQAISSGVETTRPSKQTDNNLFMASSYLSVPAADWSTGKKYTCQATHESKIIEKSVKHSECV